MRKGKSVSSPPITVEDTTMGAGPLPSPALEDLHHGKFPQEEKNEKTSAQKSQNGVGHV
jgi:hypothetical protein